jgi:NTP pyrophosphatase (non-canonical NTP hydrolase)
MKNIKDIQEILNDFEKDYWIAPEDKKGKTAHIVFHMTKMLGKIGSQCEKVDHGFNADEDLIKNEVIPDLLYYALSLSNIYDVDLEEVFLNRLETNKKKINSWKK